MKRLYYLAPDLDTTEHIAEDLHQAGISDWHFHVLSRDQRGLYQHRIHSATVLQRLDVVHMAERGALVGAIFGGLVATVLWLVNPAGFPMDAKMFSLILVVSTLFGTWVGGMAGLSHQNYKIARFMDQVQEGQHLLMVDIRRRQAPKVRTLLNERYPKVRLVGVGTTWSNPLKPGTPYQPMR